MRTDTRYSASSFDTFPFVHGDPSETSPALEAIGRQLHEVRASFMINENIGLTITYNYLKDRACDDARILELRKLHEEMDGRVLEAYAEGDPEGHWLEVEVPPFCPMDDEDKKKLEKFEDAVLHRLFLLNAKRAEAEKLKGLAAWPSKPRKRAATSQPRLPGKTRGGKLIKDQLTLTSSDPDAES
jgi:hypothetical protein